MIEGTKEENYRQIKGFDRQPLWIINGASNLGKSYIASHLTSLSIYETDSSNEILEKLPNVDVAVTGKKTLGDIKHLLPKEKKCISVTFTEL